ncbi:MAG: hypothetical protein M1821_001050 [Bathelium mastoideum]|nr:MAG: hypothetical protein M1821_001050 [Bathelium mastoideum]
MTEFDAILEKWTDPKQNYMHGASFIAYDKTGRCVYSGAQGTRTVDRSTGIPAKVDDLCYLASQSKLITSVAVMKLVEKGLVGLDDDCGKIVRQLANKDVLVDLEGDESQTGKEFNMAKNAFTFKNPRKPILRKATKPITLRLLLSHSSGFSYPLASPNLQECLTYQGINDDAESTLEQWNIPLIYEPGESWSYGPGIDWAGRVLEIITGQTLDEYMQENICNRLGMKNTTFFPDSRLDSLPPQMELGFKPDGSNGKIVKGSANMYTTQPCQDCLGGSGIYSNCEDYGLFLKALVGGGEPLLSRDSVNTLFTGTVTNRKDLMVWAQGKFRSAMTAEIVENTEVDHSLGGLVNLAPVPGRRAEGSVKWGGMSNPLWWVDMKTGVAGTILTQIYPFGDPAVSECLIELEAEVYKRISKASL